MNHFGYPLQNMTWTPSSHIRNASFSLASRPAGGGPCGGGPEVLSLFCQGLHLLQQCFGFNCVHPATFTKVAQVRLATAQGCERQTRAPSPTRIVHRLLPPCCRTVPQRLTGTAPSHSHSKQCKLLLGPFFLACPCFPSHGAASLPSRLLASCVAASLGCPPTLSSGAPLNCLLSLSCFCLSFLRPSWRPQSWRAYVSSPLHLPRNCWACASSPSSLFHTFSAPFFFFLSFLLLLGELEVFGFLQLGAADWASCNSKEPPGILQIFLTSQPLFLVTHCGLFSKNFVWQHARLTAHSWLLLHL